MNPALLILRDMVAADLELAYEHLCNGQPALARHELQNAQEKISQIEDLNLNSNPTAETQPLLDIEPAATAQEPSGDSPHHAQGTTTATATRTHPQNRRRKTG